MTDWDVQAAYQEALVYTTQERDELARQLEEARRLACHYADLLHQAHGSRGIIEPDWKAS